MHIKHQLRKVLLTTVLLGTIFPTLQVSAQQQSAFTGSPPIFNGEESPHKGIYIPSTHYYFKFSLPQKSNTPIGEILIEPQPNIQEIALILSETKAFLGTPDGRGNELKISSVTQDPTSRVITVSFAQPINPGTDFTIGLQTVENPAFPGIYQYRVYAVPSGPSPVAMTLGVARFHFYSGGSSSD